LWLSPPVEGDQVALKSDLKRQVDSGDTRHFTDEDRIVEAAARRAIEELGFMLRAPITVMTTITWTLGAPFWVFMPKSRTYHLAIDVIHQQYKAQIVQPWLESMREEGERTLLGIISLSSNAARDSLNNALEREEARYQRELENKQKPLDPEVVEHLVAAYVNLLAAEEALQELSGRIDRR
jgi:AcrR family transcriptional regulator